MKNIKYASETRLHGGRAVEIGDVAHHETLEQDPALTLRLLQSLLTNAPVGVVFVDRELRFLHINERLAEINGISVAAHIGRTVAEIVPSLEAALREVTERIRETGQPVLDHEFAGETRSLPGITRWWTESWYPVHDGRGDIVGFGGVVVEITERKKSDVALRLANDRFELAVKASKAVLWQQDLDLYFTWRHDPAQGVEGSDAVGTREEDFLERAEDVAVIEELKREVMRSGVGMREELSPQIQGEVRCFELLMEPLRDAAGRITGLTGAAIDITDRKRAEQARVSLEAQLRESQKMEALGTLAGGIAHDFNNILGVILMNAELARQDVGANGHALVSLDEILNATHRAGDLVHQILAFGRRKSMVRKLLSLPSAVDESVRLLRAVLSGKVRIEYYCATDTPAVVADASQLQQVIMNLGNNAAYAMEGRAGCIDIRVEGVVLDNTSAQLAHNLQPGRYARITVSDTGSGMEVDTQRRIFEPFFTTKPLGKGTGLGLSVVHGILEAHGAAILVHSEPGKGSRFEVYFPGLNQVAAVPGATETSGEASEGRGQHILYIDDDQPQLFANKRMLEHWGYRVSAYLEPHEALEAVLAGTARFDLVMTDFNMPGTSGLQIARAIHNALPALPIIIVSGFITDELRVQAAKVGVQYLIGKPQNLERLRGILQSLLNPLSGESS